MSTPAIQLHQRFENDPCGGYATPAAFLNATIREAGAHSRDDVIDMRLRSLCARDDSGELAFMLPSGFAPRAAVGSDEQGEYADQYGGFAVPPAAVLPGALAAVESDPTAGRTRAFPMSVPTLDIPARTDKDHSTSLTGGFTATRNPETVSFPASRGALELVSLKATSLVGLAFATEEVLMDSAGSFAALIGTAFRDEFAGILLNEKIRGGGGTEYAGVLNAACKIEVAKESGQAADTIVAANVLKMRARCWRYGGAIWLANYDTCEQLAALSIAVGTGGALIYQASNAEGLPDMLAGAPVFYTEHASTLGDEGDLILANWGEYLEGTLQPFTGASSIHVRFVSHESVLKFWVRNCGAPWWRSALTPANGSATLSPVVTLAERA